MVRVVVPCWMGWSRISFIRAMLVRVLMTAARFCSAAWRGSYSREATKRNRKKVSTSRLPWTSSTDPTNATVAMPSFRIRDALTTKAARENSLMVDRRSTARIFSVSPAR